MDSLVKRGNGYGYGGYGYGNSKPQMNYHRQNTESVTTVVTEINRMTVNDDKPGYDGVQKQQACKVEAFQEHDDAYNGAVDVHQKHSFKEKEEKYGAAAAVTKHDEYKEKYGAHHYGGAGEKKQGYNYRQGAYGGTEAAGYGAGGGVNKQGYGYTQEACGESDVAGYGAHHGGSGAAVQTYAYDQQAAYGGAIGAAVQQQAYKDKDAASKMNGSQQVYGYGESVDAAGAGYGAHHGGGAVHQQHGYQKDAYWYGGAVNKNTGYQEKYRGTGAGGYGYGGAHYDGGGAAAVQKTGYQEKYGGTGAGGYGFGGAHYGGGGAAAVQKTGAAVQKIGYQEKYGGTGARGYGYGYMHQDVYESESDESDCEAEAFPPRGGRLHGGGGVQYSYGAYQEKNGAVNHGRVRRYESYETREELGGGRSYEPYQTTVQYTGGGCGGYAPIKNRHFLRYGA